ncbi:MAG: hypothetical protein H0U74_19615 [Bradymonadaceae bacterium]|nr:hypothetical protein [Lujinxingiaceae bacterium]
MQRALVEGDAYALELTGPLGTARVVADGLKAMLKGRDDLAERVAHSFGGAVTDRFTQNRLKEIHRRVVKCMLTEQPRRGFDALVSVLSSDTDLIEGATMEAQVAELIGASQDDMVVRNLVVRIRRKVEDDS